MNIEIEKKYKISDYEETKTKIKKLGAEKISLKTTNDRYFEVPQRIAKTKYLRIRFGKDTQNGTLAYHEVVDDLQTKEWEIEVDQGNMAQQILEKLGFQPEVDVYKEREKFKLDQSEIVLDKVKNLGNFIEIESPNLETLEKIALNLDLEEKNIISGLGYPDLIKEKNENTSK